MLRELVYIKDVCKLSTGAPLEMLIINKYNINKTNKRNTILLNPGETTFFVSNREENPVGFPFSARNCYIVILRNIANISYHSEILEVIS